MLLPLPISLLGQWMKLYEKVLAEKVSLPPSNSRTSFIKTLKKQQAKKGKAKRMCRIGFWQLLPIFLINMDLATCQPKRVQNLLSPEPEVSDKSKLETDYYKPKEYRSRDFPRLVDGLGQQIRRDLDEVRYQFIPQLFAFADPLRLGFARKTGATCSRANGSP